MASVSEVHEQASFNEQASIRGREEAIKDYAQNQKEKAGVTYRHFVL